YGYVGCVTLQLICFIFVFKPEWFGITDPSFPARFSFLLVGLWWLGFSFIPFRALPKDRPHKQKGEVSIFKKATGEFAQVLKAVKANPYIKRFLPAYFFYSMGVQTLMIVAAAFGEKVLQLGASKLIATI